MLFIQHLHQRQNNTNECRERSARELSKRGDHQHLDVPPAQRHRSHIDHLTIGTLTQTRETLTQVIPLLDREMQQQTYAHTHRRLKESEQAVYQRVALGLHLRDEHNHYKRDGCNTTLIVDVENHTQHLQHKDREQHTHNREGQ